LTTPIGPPRLSGPAAKPNPRTARHEGRVAGGPIRNSVSRRGPGSSSAHSVIRKGSFDRHRPTSRRSLPDPTCYCSVESATHRTHESREPEGRRFTRR
jgi:hypothetical protein